MTEKRNPGVKGRATHDEVRRTIEDKTNTLPLPGLREFPTYRATNNAAFEWGCVDDEAFVDLIQTAYGEIVHWQRITFSIPSGLTGKDFVMELAWTYQAHVDSSSIESISQSAAMVFLFFMLQKPHQDSNQNIMPPV